MNDIVVGYDGSDCGRAALEEAGSLAKELGDRIVIVYGYAPGGYGGGEIPTHREAVEEIGKRVTAQAQRRADEIGVLNEVELIALKPDHALVQISEQRDARMIVVGTHSDPPLRGAILGSTPHKLLHEAKVPVLVVPAGEAA